MSVILIVSVAAHLTIAEFVFTKAQAESPQTLIKTENGTIVFLVGGQEQARLDASGLHVNGDVNYSGAITDTVTYRPSAVAEKAGVE